MMEQAYHWDRLLRAVRRSPTMTHMQRCDLAAFIKESTNDDALHSAADRLLAGELTETQINPHLDASFKVSEYRVGLSARTKKHYDITLPEKTGWLKRLRAYLHL